jgi:uncharacterized protein (DUF1778 family)
MVDDDCWQSTMTAGKGVDEQPIDPVPAYMIADRIPPTGRSHLQTFRSSRTLSYMVKSERLEARAAPTDVRRIEAAARATSLSVSAFVVAAARAEADRVLLEQEETVVPNDYFVRLLVKLDEPPREIPALAAAVERAKAHPVISR